MDNYKYAYWLLLFAVTTISCLEQHEQKFTSVIVGFWKVGNIMQGKNSVNLYAQIDQQSIQYFHPDIDYLLLQYYSVDKGNTVTIYADSLHSKKKQTLGKGRWITQDSFCITNATQVLTFSRSSTEDFKKQIGQEWID